MRNEAPVIVLAEWAAQTNAETRAFMGVSVTPEIPERQEARAYLAGFMSDDEAAACVAADLERVDRLKFEPISDDLADPNGSKNDPFGSSADDYAGLSPNFAALCRKADDRRRNSTVSPIIERARRLLADDVTLERAWHELNKPAGVAASTLKAAEYLVRANDPKQLRQWLDRHSADERTAIQKHLGGNACR
jgi:hypothetical protein